MVRTIADYTESSEISGSFATVVAFVEGMNPNKLKQTCSNYDNFCISEACQEALIDEVRSMEARMLLMKTVPKR